VHAKPASTAPTANSTAAFAHHSAITVPDRVTRIVQTAQKTRTRTRSTAFVSAYLITTARLLVFMVAHAHPSAIRAMDQRMPTALSARSMRSSLLTGGVFVHLTGVARPVTCLLDSAEINARSA
jgi:hypothetical protein